MYMIRALNRANLLSSSDPETLLSKVFCDSASYTCCAGKCPNCPKNNPLDLVPYLRLEDADSAKMISYRQWRGDETHVYKSSPVGACNAFA